VLLAYLLCFWAIAGNIVDHTELLVSANHLQNDTGYGPFQRHVGLDATSIYAAATSGSKVIALHLLVCMLARSWSGPEAIAIWVELVEERKKEIEAESNPNELHGMLARATAQQEISRAHLAAWDASARAWLRSADEVKRFEQTQLRLIIKDSGLPVSTSGTTYSSVVEAWTVAMTSLQKLILGIPQNISKGSVLVGLLSWHIYPDLNVVEPTANIQFHDPLIKMGGVVTLGLQRKDSIGSGVHWSLALSHLRFYGDPVPVEKSIGSDTGRLTFPELHLVALGSVISSWSEPAEVDILEAADCFVALGRCLSNNNDERQEIEGLGSDLHWLDILVKAANSLLDSSGIDREHGLGLVEYGRRRGRAFLDPYFRDRVPMFGLANPLRLFRLSDEITQYKNDIQASLTALRRLAKECQFGPYDCIIRYSPVRRVDANEATSHTHEYTTAIEIPRTSNKRDRDGQARVESGHLYWAYADAAPSTLDIKGIYTVPMPKGEQALPSYFDSFRLKCSCFPECLQECPCLNRGTYCTSLCAGYSRNKMQGDSGFRNLRLRRFLTKHYGWRSVSNPTLFKKGWIMEFDAIQLRPAPSFFAERYNDLFRQNYRLAFCEESDCTEIDAPESADYRLIAGDLVLSLLLSSLAPIQIPSLSISDLTKSLRSGLINGSMLIEYLSSSALNDPVSEMIGHSDNASYGTFLLSLQAMAAATELYSEWPEATVSIEITRHTLAMAHWVHSFREDGSWGAGKKLPRTRPNNNQHLIKPESEYYRAAKFAAIAMLESGTENLHPDQLFSVMAMGSGNSIYVDDRLLQDPSETSLSNSPIFGGIRRILGSLDRPGIIFLVPPQVPRILEVDLSSWRFSQQTIFDGSSKNSFKQTSLHLSFTEYEIPLGGARGGRDVAAVMLETLVSVHDGRQWVADLDILGSLAMLPWEGEGDGICRCGHLPNDNLGYMLSTSYRLKLKSLETWDDLLCCKENLLGSEIGVVRTYNNPYSRLAAAAVCVQKGFYVCILPSHLICTHHYPESLVWQIERQARDRDERLGPYILIA
jgi:hypothetical protein